MNRTYRILNLGAGVQSTTIALMGVKNWENRQCSQPLLYESVGLIDWAIFADTQEEPQAVYEHLEWLKAKCEPFFPVLVRTAGKLGQYLEDGKSVVNKGPVLAKAGYVSIPAYLTREPGVKPETVVPRECTRNFKLEVIDRTIRYEILGLNPGQRVPPKAEVTQLLGLSYDEAARIIRVKASHQGHPFEFRFPLFEMEMTRGGCKNWLAKQNIPHQVPRSACVFCPYRSNAQFKDLKENHPKDWARAVYIDYALRNFESTPKPRKGFIAYVHKSCVPLDQVDLDDPETKERKKGQEMFGFLAECEGMCGV